jgi:nucleoside-diphosphate-sugar epimerase
VLNRGMTSVPLPKGVEALVGDMHGEAYAALGDRTFDVVAQFRLYTPEEMQRDIALFAGKVGQYVFISSASVYEKPVQDCPMTERTRQHNPFWEYSRRKTKCEEMLRGQSALPYTIIRPSHTVRTGMPIQLGNPDAALRRMIAGKPVVVAGDGLSLWALTRSVDLAVPLVKLLGNAAALNHEYQITHDRSFTWTQIHEAIARGFGVEAKHAHVPTATLIRYNNEWEGPLLGDKSWSVIFDNSKVKRVAGDFTCAEDLDTILADSIMHAKERLKAPAPPPTDEDRLLERIVVEQGKLGA